MKNNKLFIIVLFLIILKSIVVNGQNSKTNFEIQYIDLTRQLYSERDDNKKRTITMSLINIIDNLIILDSNSKNNYVEKIKFLTNIKEYDKAIKTFQIYENKFDTNNIIPFQLGNILELSGQKRKSDSAYKAFLQKNLKLHNSNPKQEIYIYNILSLYIGLKLYNKAQEFLERVKNQNLINEEKYIIMKSLLDKKRTIIKK